MVTTLAALGGCASSNGTPPALERPRANGADIYRSVFELLDRSGESARLLNDEASRLVQNDKPYDPSDWSGQLADCEPALVEMGRAAGIEECSFGPAYELDSELPWVGPARRLARVNAVLSWHLVATGRGDEALVPWERGFVFARHIASDGGMIQGLVAIAVVGITLEPIRRAIQEDRLDDSTLVKIVKLLEAQPYGFLSIANSMRQERAAHARAGEAWMRSPDPFVAFDEYLASINPSSPRSDNFIYDLPPRLRQMLLWGIPLHDYLDEEATREAFRAELGVMLEVMGELEILAKRPYHEVMASLQSLEDRLEEMSEDYRDHVLTSFFVPSMTSILRTRANSEARRRGLIAMCEIRRFMREHGRVPADGDLPGLPRDPCRELPMRLEVTTEEVILHCEIDREDEELRAKHPFSFGVYRVPIPENLRAR